MNWKQSDIDKLVKDGKIKGYTEISKKRPSVSKNVQNKSKSAQKFPVALQYIEKALQRAGIEYVTEHRFHPVRKFRFDIAILDKKIAIEYEGLMSSKSRHTTIGGYTRDATKYNLATSEGWKVYRYTAKNYREFIEDLKLIAE